MKCDRCGSVINTNKLIMTISDKAKEDKTVFCDKCAAEFMMLSEIGMNAVRDVNKFHQKMIVIR